MYIEQYVLVSIWNAPHDLAEAFEDTFNDPKNIGFRKHIGVKLGYNDRNDGFARTWFSRNKCNRSRIYKENRRRWTRGYKNKYNRNKLLMRFEINEIAKISFEQSVKKAKEMAEYNFAYIDDNGVAYRGNLV